MNFIVCEVPTRVPSALLKDISTWVARTLNHVLRRSSG